MPEFNIDDTVHVYIKGWDLYEAKITAKEGDLISVEFAGGFLLNFDPETGGPTPNHTFTEGVAWGTASEPTNGTYLDTPVTISNINLAQMYPSVVPRGVTVPVWHQSNQLSEWKDSEDVVHDKLVVCEYDPDLPVEGFDEMTEMAKLNDCELARSLQNKFNRHDCYSTCGVTLVGMNLMEPKEHYAEPGAPLYHVFSEETKNFYREAPLASLKQPGAVKAHVYNLGSRCFQSLFVPPAAPAKHQNQAVIITGESGAGKSFQTKQMLDYLAHVGSNENEEGGQVEQMKDMTEDERNEAFHAIADLDERAICVEQFKKKMRLSYVESLRAKDGEAAAEDFQIKLKQHKPVTTRMLDATPILEGWGNANMPRNPDSSRFGKLYQVYFDQGSETIVGCHVEPYMLEKSRVSSQQINERNFHIFYRIILGDWGGGAFMRTSETGKVTRYPPLPAEGIQKYCIPTGSVRDKIMKFSYLRGGATAGGECRIPENDVYLDFRPGTNGAADKSFDDAKDMAETYEAMRSFFDQDQIDAYLKITMGCLWMGNIRFTEGSASEAREDDEGSKEALDAVCNLWGVDRAKLKKAMAHKTIIVNDAPIVKNFSHQGAIEHRDSMARTVYDTVFTDGLVQSVSDNLEAGDGQRGVRKGTDHWFGVLDIFGFEFVETDAIVSDDKQTEKPMKLNSLEQFCINLCNEQLQNHFVECIFKNEEHLYESELGQTEGKKVKIDFTKNDDTLKYISTIIDTLDDTAKSQSQKASGGAEVQPADGDVEFFKRLKKRFPIQARAKRNKTQLSEVPQISYPPEMGSHAYHGASHMDHEQSAFDLVHYASKVRYDVRDWCTKDADELTLDIIECLGTSTLVSHGSHKFLAEAFPVGKETDKDQVAGGFRTKLKDLIVKLKEAESNFVRCLKASDPLAQGRFCPQNVLTQLQYTGMLDTLKIRRGGYAMRISQAKFYEHYHCLALGAPDCNALVSYISQNMNELVVADMNETEIIASRDPVVGYANAIKMGKTLVLGKDWLGRELDRLRKEKMQGSALVVQSQYSAHENHRMFQRKKELCSQLKPVFQAALARKQFKEMYRNKWEKFERHRVQEYIHATVQRQGFYELKRKDELVQKKLLDLKTAHETSSDLYQKYVNGVAIKLEQTKLKMENLIKDMDDEQAAKVAEHLDTMGAIQAQVSAKQATMDSKKAELEAEQTKYDTIKTEAAKDKLAREAALRATEAAWATRKAGAEKELAELRARPAVIRAENDETITGLQHTLQATNDNNDEEEAKIKGQWQSTIDEIEEAKSQLAASKAEAEERQRDNTKNIAYLEEDMRTIDDRHLKEQENLQSQLAAQNWQLVELRQKEMQAEDEYQVLLRHGHVMTGAEGSGVDQEEVDILEQKIHMVTQMVHEKSAQFDKKMEMVKAAMQAEQDAAAAWDVAKQDQEAQVKALQEAIAQEKAQSADLNTQAVHARPQISTRTSRFATKSYEARPSAAYTLAAAPPAAAPTSDLPTSPATMFKVGNSTAAPAYGAYGRSVDDIVARAMDPSRPSAQETGVLSSTQAATVSALYSGSLGQGGWPAKGMETMDPTTMRHALRLLR